MRALWRHPLSRNISTGGAELKLQLDSDTKYRNSKSEHRHHPKSEFAHPVVWS